MSERFNQTRGAEIARLVAQQRADQALDQAGRCATPNAECDTGLHFESGLTIVRDRNQTAAWRDVNRVEVAYHGGASAADASDRMQV